MILIAIARLGSRCATFKWVLGFACLNGSRPWGRNWSYAGTRRHTRRHRRPTLLVFVDQLFDKVNSWTYSNISSDDRSQATMLLQLFDKVNSWIYSNISSDDRSQASILLQLFDKVNKWIYSNISSNDRLQVTMLLQLFDKVNSWIYLNISSDDKSQRLIAWDSICKYEYYLLREIFLSQQHSRVEVFFA